MRTCGKRLNKFNLEVAEEKTRIIAFGRFADKESKKQGRRNQIHLIYWGLLTTAVKARKAGFQKRKTSQKKYRSSLLKCKTWLRKHLISPTDYVIEMLQIKLQGYYRYYGITDNSTALRNFCDKVRRMLFKWFNRRSQRKSMNWDKYVRFLNKHPLPKGRIYVDIYDVRPELLSYLK